MATLDAVLTPALAHGFELVLDAGQPVLFAVQLVGERLELAAQSVDHLNVCVHLVRKPAHVRLLLDPQVIFQAG